MNTHRDGALGEANAGRAAAIVVACLGVTAFVGWMDVVTGPDWGLSLFYLMPIVGCGWWAGRRAAAAVATACAAAWLAADLSTHAAGREHVSVWNGFTHLAIYLFVGVSVAASRRDRARLADLLGRSEALARTDALTGLTNSRGFHERLESELPRLARSGAPVCVAYLDLDNFKKVNDRFGHPAGDDVLRRVAVLLRGLVRKGDVVARLGGDELAIALWDCTAAGAEATCRRIIEQIGPLGRDYPGTDLGASAGVAWFERAPGGVQDVVAAADEAMYEAKRAGKGQVACVRVDANREEQADAIDANGACALEARPGAEAARSG